MRATYGIAGALSIAVLSVLPTTAQATFPGENGEIALVSARSCTEPCDDSSADVFLLEGIAFDPVQLTTDAGQHRHPSWSPDLEKLAYARWTSGSDNQKIFIDDLSVGGPVTQRLGPHDSTVLDDRPAWSPDGTRIAYESEVTNGSNQLDILVVDMNDGSFINLTQTASVTEGKPFWSPDGKWIYYHSNLTGDQDIRRERSNNSSTVAQTIVGSAGNQFQGALSPDGKELCYTQGSFSNDADVIVRSVDSSGSPEEISDETVTVADYNCAWSPDGELVTWVNGLTSEGDPVYKNADDTGSILPLINDLPDAFDGNQDWAPRDPALCRGKGATIAGTSVADQLVGTAGKDVIIAHGGADEINGKGGKDTICGAKGGDTIRGGGGNDKLYGEGGSDELIGGSGKDKCDGGSGRDREQGCER
jgi:Tol biopolymer transport system component